MNRVIPSRPARCLTFLGAALFFFTPQSALPQAESLVPATDRRIVPNDILAIDVFEEPDMSVERQVQESGRITYWELGELDVAGKTPMQVAKQLQDELGRDYLVNPQVNVAIKKHAELTINVAGEVNKKGKYPLPSEEKWTIVDAITKAEGFTRDAHRGKIEFTRNGITRRFDWDKLMRQSSDSTQAIYLEPGDIIYVESRFF